MEFNEKFYSEIQSQLGKLNMSHMRTISAVPKSLQSDLSLDENQYWDLVIQKSTRNNPRELIALLVLVSKVKPFWYQLFLDFVANQCKRYSYQGMWRVLHKLAKLYHHNLILYRICETMDPNAFFGNYFQTIKKQSLNCPCRYLKLTRPRPKYAQRKRGYNDHGSRKLSHERHDFSYHSGENPEKEDHRDQYKKRSSFVNFLYG